MAKHTKAWYIELLPTIVVVAILGVIGAFAIGSHWRSASTTNKSGAIRRPVVGSKVNISGESFADHESTLILALQENCHFCSDSAAFYRYLEHAAADKKGLHLMIIMPRQGTHEYVAKLGLKIEDVRTTLFDTLNISGTPTLILVDKNSVIRKVWIGKLPSYMESDVLNTLGIPLQEACDQCAINAHN